MFLRAVLAALAIGAAALLVGSLGGDKRPSFPAADYRGLPPIGDDGVLVGTNYTHTSFRGCEWDDDAVLFTYHRDGVARRVHDQLRAMRRNGVESLRTIVWHMHRIGQSRWGPVPSAGGRIGEPYRSNLIAYLKEVRRFGFRRLTMSFSPQGANSPLRDEYDDALFGENRAFLDDVRALVKRHGPRDTRFDLINEGAPSDYLDAPLRTRMTRYAERIWSEYVRRHGRGDATISVIGPEDAGDAGHRLRNLVDALKRTGAGLPRWIELHLTVPPAVAAAGLREAAREGRRPIVVGETSYDDPAVAGALARHDDRAAPVEEVLPWYHRPGERCNASPPYRVGAYQRALTAPAP